MRPSSAHVDPARKYLYKEERITGKDGSSTTGTSVPENETDASSSRGNGPPPRPPSQATGSLAENGNSYRWNAALANVTEIGNSLESLQRLLVGKAVYLDEDPFTNASENAQISRTMRAQDRRIQALERELDAAVIAGGHARAERKQAEIALQLAERRTQQVSEELENTSQVFNLHAEELRAKSEEAMQKDAEIKVLQAIIDTLSEGAKNKRF